MSQMQGKYEKKCKGCRKPFRTDSRNAQFAPSEICSCLERRAKNRQKRAKERRQYHRDPEIYKARSRSRAAARKLVLAHFGITMKSNKILIDKTKIAGFGCNSQGCSRNLNTVLRKELAHREKNGISNRGALLKSVKTLLRSLEAHHRDHDCFNNTFGDTYPTTSNIELLCRAHHEQADRAKAGKAEIVLWSPPKPSWFEFLATVYATDRRKFYLVPVIDLLEEYNASI